MWLKEQLEDEQHPGRIYLLDSLTQADSFAHDIAVAASPGWSPDTANVQFVSQVLLFRNIIMLLQSFQVYQQAIHILHTHKDIFISIPNTKDLKKQAEFYRRMGRKCLKKMYLTWVKKIYNPKIKMGSYVIQGVPFL